MSGRSQIPGVELTSASLLAPFPSLPARVIEEYAPGDLWLRPFGDFTEDLNVNFDQYPPPFIVTSLLQCCTVVKEGGVPDQGFYWDLTVGKRIECALTIATLKSEERLAVELQCSNSACREEIEVDVPVRELIDLQRHADEEGLVELKIEGQSVPLRKPTGRDQLEWLKLSFSDDTDALRTIIQTLAKDGENFAHLLRVPISDVLVGTLGKSMEESDPLVGYTLTAHCPYCEGEDAYQVELQELVLRRLREAQTNLIASIHKIALRYHWNEPEILAIPPWRRRRYIARIEEEHV